MVVGIFAVAILSFASLCDLLSLVVGGVYPAYRSMNALLDGKAAAERKWLTYWVVAALFLIPDFVYGAHPAELRIIN